MRSSGSVEHLDLSTVSEIKWASSIALSTNKQNLAAFESLSVNGPYSLKIIRIRTVTRETRTLLGPNSAGYLDGPSSVAQFNGPTAAAYSPDDSWLAVADAANNVIRRVDASTGAATTVAGYVQGGYADGRGSAARFSYPTGVAFAPAGAPRLFVSDSGTNTIRVIDLATSVVSTLAGAAEGNFPNFVGSYLDDLGAAAAFKGPRGIAVSPDGAAVYVADTGNHAIRRIALATAAVTTVAGSAFPGFNDGASPQFRYPSAVAAHPSLPLLAVADTANRCLRIVNVASGAADTVAGAVAGSAHNDSSGPAASVALGEVYGVTYADGGRIYAADRTMGLVRMLAAITCGDGLWAGSEQCDGGPAGAPGCTPACRAATGFYCSAACRDYCPGLFPSVCATRCGDGVIAGAEQCDPGQGADEGCGPDCAARLGYRCGPRPPPAGPVVCATVCGDGIVAGAERCDGGVGCTPNCTLVADAAAAGRPAAAGPYYVRANVSVQVDAGAGAGAAGDAAAVGAAGAPPAAAALACGSCIVQLVTAAAARRDVEGSSSRWAGGGRRREGGGQRAAGEGGRTFYYLLRVQVERWSFRSICLPASIF
jgi:cysteine-rich repeat protein